jgi:hypothetical protein
MLPMKLRTAQIAVTVLFAFLSGCGQARPQSPAQKESGPLVDAEISARRSAFDVTRTGSIQGIVTWSGGLPDVPPFEIRNFVSLSTAPQPRLVRRNPNAPAVDLESKGIANAVVFLRGVSLTEGRPWDHAPVTIEHCDRQLDVIQDSFKGPVGFVRKGTPVTMVSREKAFNALHASGSAFFTLPFPEPDEPLTRVLNENGLVELASGAGCYWMRAYLFVTDHPYFARTSADGRFLLESVPPGSYQLCCWLPNWHIASQDRDPETMLVTRMFFHSPLEVNQEVAVAAGMRATANFTVTASQFKR